MKGTYLAHEYPTLVSTSICGARSPSHSLRRISLPLPPLVDCAWFHQLIHTGSRTVHLFRSFTPRFHGFVAADPFPPYLYIPQFFFASSFFLSRNFESIDRAHSSIRSTELSHSLAALCFHHLISQYYTRGSAPDCNQSESNFLVNM